MFLATLPLDQITEQHIRRLVDDAVPESLDVEYKRDAVADDRDARREFLRDLSALANTTGGHLIFGIEERHGIPNAVLGLTSRSPDEEKLRLENLIRDGIEPRLVGVSMKEVSLAGGGYALVVRVAPSWNPPHRVAFGGTNKFFARNSAGVYELSVDQLRSVFLNAQSVEARLNEFRTARLARLNTGEGIRLSASGHAVLHVSPVAQGNAVLDVDVVAKNTQMFTPLGDSGHTTRFNFDGLLLTSGLSEGGRHGAYTQVFRDGRIETASSGYVGERRERGLERVLFYGDLIPHLLKAIPRLVGGLHQHGWGPPYAVMVSLLDVRGSVMLSRDAFRDAPRLDRDRLIFEPILLQDAGFESGWEASLRPMLDAWWNAYGWSRCVHLYDTEGKFTGVPRHW